MTANNTTQEFEKPLQNFYKDGFVSLGKLLDAEELKTLQEECFTMLAKPAMTLEESKLANKKSFLFKTNEVKIQINPQGQSSKLDALLEKIVSHPQIENLLKAFYGEDFFLWEIVIRRTEKGSKPLPMHQDGVGGLAVSILLDDVKSRYGTTFLLPGSHRYPFSMSEVGGGVHPKFYAPFGVPHVGELGDTCVFVGTTWHARYHNPLDNTPTSIWLSFDSPKYFQGDNSGVPQEMLQAVGPRLAQLLTYSPLKAGSPENKNSLLYKLTHPGPSSKKHLVLKCVFKSLATLFEGGRKIRAVFRSTVSLGANNAGYR